MLSAGDSRMEWTLRLAGMGIDGQFRSFEVMAISRPDGVGDIANLGASRPTAGSPGSRDRPSSCHGSVSARANKYSWPDEGRGCSGGLQHPQNRCGAAKEVEPAVVGGDWLIGSGAGTEKVA